MAARGRAKLPTAQRSRGQWRILTFANAEGRSEPYDLNGPAPAQSRHKTA